MTKQDKSKAERAPNVRYYSLYRFATRYDMILICASMLSSVIAGLAMPLAITLVADIFHVMITHEKGPKTNENNAKFLETMHKFSLNYSLVGFVIFVSLYIGTAFIEIAALNQIFQIKEAYLRAALYQDMSYFDQQQTGDFASKMSDDVLKLEEGIGQKVSSFVYNTTASLSCIFMAFCKGWKLTLMCLVTAPVTFLLVIATGLIANRFYKEEAVQTGLASAVAEEVISSIRTVYAYNGQEKELERYGRPLAKARQIHIRKELFTGLAMSLLAFGMFCSYGLSFYFGAYLMVHEPNLYDANIMFSVFFGVVNGLTYSGMAGSLVVIFGSACGAAAQIFRLIDNKPNINPYQDRGIKPHAIEGNIELRNVIFHYPARPDVMVLKNISLSVKRGQSVALVGHSGCGKSSIIQLIVRYYDVIGGRVLVDGRDVKDLSVRWLRAQVGLVGQEPVLFNTSVRENIRYGREDASDADIEAAARQANAHQFILKLPKGYDTLVGERGASLSGGQKQRIAIARALIRNPSILLLDEATSALDTASEKEVQIALEKASEGRTIVVVAHRLSTIRNVNLIYVMKDGVIVEKGSHVELVAMRGLYYDMVKLQEPEPIVTDSKVKEIDKTENDDQDRGEPDTFQDEEEEANSVSFRKALELNAPEWKLIFMGCVCGFIVGFSMPLVVVAFGYLFGSLSNPSPEVMFKEVSLVSMICVGIGLAIGGSTFIQAVCFGMAGAYLTERLRRRMFEHMLRQDVAFFDRRANSTGALCAKLSAEAAHVRGATGQRVSVLVQGVGTVCLSFTMAMVYDWRVALVALAFVPFILPVMYYQSVTAAKMSTTNAKAVENSTQIAIEAVSNIRTVTALGREEAVVREFVAELARVMPLAKRAAHFFGLVSGLSHAMFNFMNATALSYGGHLIVSEQLAYEKILVTTQSIQMAAGQVHDVLAYTPDFQKGKAAAARVLELLRTKPTVTDPAFPMITDFTASGELSFNDVQFHYPNRPGVVVLQEMNLQVPSGKTIAFVGRSGGGKSTVIQLLLRFYDPTAGVVSMDGFALPDLLKSEVRASFGLVSQEPVLFDLSVAENIAYGQISQAISRDEIIAAAKQANVHNFVVAMPEGYDTNIGKQGTQLSGGQKQRVAIARALLRRPRILLLDEATSALDTESEKVVTEALDAAKAGRTCVVIAHRLSTVRDADAICVLSGGRVAERGSHRELMDLKKLYYNMHMRVQ